MQTKAEQLRARETELTRELVDVQAELKRVSDGKSPSPAAFTNPEEVTVETYGGWSQEERGRFEGAHRERAFQLKAELFEVQRREQAKRDGTHAG